MAKTTIIMMTALIMSFGSATGDSNAFSTGSGSYESLNFDSMQDILNVSQTVNEIVGEVIKDLTPTDLFNTGTNLPLNLPLNPLNHIKGFGIDLIDVDKTDMDIGDFFDLSSISSGDILGILKGVAILSVQIFIIVVQVVWQIVQGLRRAFI